MKSGIQPNDQSVGLRPVLLLSCFLVCACFDRPAVGQQNPSPKSKIRIGPIDRPPVLALGEFEFALRRTTGGEAYLLEPVADSTGNVMRRIALFRQRGSVPPGSFLQLIQDQRRHPKLRALGLRMLSPRSRGLDLKLLTKLLNSDSPLLRLEAVRTLASRPQAGAVDALIQVAADKENAIKLRAEAVSGLASHASRYASARRLLLRLLQADNITLRDESLRALRGSTRAAADVRKSLFALAEKLRKVDPPFTGRNLELAEQLVLALADGDGEGVPWHLAEAVKQSRPTTLEDWQRALKTGGDPDAGRRVFFHANSAGCAKCHTVNGRGGRVASDLSGVGRSMNRDMLIESILEPSRQIPPNYVTWTVVTISGKVFSGLILEKSKGHITLATAEETQVEIPNGEIERLSQQKTSLMPAKLVDRLTREEFRDLLAYLKTLY